MSDKTFTSVILLKSRLVTNVVGGIALENLDLVLRNDALKTSISNIGSYSVWIDVDSADKSSYELIPNSGVVCVVIAPKDVKRLRLFVESGEEAKINIQQEGGRID